MASKNNRRGKFKLFIFLFAVIGLVIFLVVFVNKLRPPENQNTVAFEEGDTFFAYNFRKRGLTQLIPKEYSILQTGGYNAPILLKENSSGEIFYFGLKDKTIIKTNISVPKGDYNGKKGNYQEEVVFSSDGSQVIVVFWFQEEAKGVGEGMDGPKKEYINEGIYTFSTNIWEKSTIIRDLKLQPKLEGKYVDVFPIGWDNVGGLIFARRSGEGLFDNNIYLYFYKDKAVKKLAESLYPQGFGAELGVSPSLKKFFIIDSSKGTLSLYSYTDLKEKLIKEIKIEKIFAENCKIYFQFRKEPPSENDCLNENGRYLVKWSYKEDSLIIGFTKNIYSIDLESGNTFLCFTDKTRGADGYWEDISSFQLTLSLDGRYLYFVDTENKETSPEFHTEEDRFFLTMLDLKTFKYKRLWESKNSLWWLVPVSL